MSIHHSLYSLESRVRNGTAPDSPAHLQTYLEVSQESASSLPLTARRYLYIHVFNVLTAAVADHRVARQWRQLCLDHACFPLHRLRPLCKTPQQQHELLLMKYHLAHIGPHMN
ncbi:hypothetical protein [Marinobacterium marinum]|uniref:Uncharacterized protein n=1 Tax=Marinobacterium marinum TaxID=2756129 RepID=A0A7W1WVV5_9GAMM|nr:hypothetical protein [Marinobacterium marinum]MBA4501168.1 hypothetical protein [Marinobacterium marinum]